MQGMLLAESAILLDFHSVRMSLLILRRIVVTLFTFRTCQCDPCAHLATSTCITIRLILIFLIF